MWKWIVSHVLVAALSGLLVAGFLYNHKRCEPDPCDEELRFVGQHPNATLKEVIVTTEFPSHTDHTCLLLSPSRGGEIGDGDYRYTDPEIQRVLEDWSAAKKGELRLNLLCTVREKPTVNTIRQVVNRLRDLAPAGVALTITIHVLTAG
jgi:hypothetical protein